MFELIASKVETASFSLNHRICQIKISYAVVTKKLPDLNGIQ